MNIERHKQKLDEEKVRCESEMGGVGRRNLSVPDDWEAVPSVTGAEPDLVDQADVITSNENNSAILADLEARYDSVLAALRRIENETYGICEVCSGTIEEERLTADPTASTCIKHV